MEYNKMDKINSTELHKVEMELCYFLEENKLTREDIINRFTFLM